MSLEVKILGSNAAAPAHHRNQSSQVVVINDQYYMVDCGEAAQIQLKRYGLKINRINHIFISHLHGDHYYGLMGLLSTMHLYGRKKELQLYAPPGLSEIISLQLRYSETSLAFDVNLREWKPGVQERLFEDELLEIFCFPLNHRIPCMGFVFREKAKKRRINKAALTQPIAPIHINALKEGRDVLDEEGRVRYRNSDYTLPPRYAYSYAYCSDTKFDPGIEKYILNVDILYHEATFTEEFKERAAQTYHSTALEAAKMANIANAKKLLIGHFSNRYRELHELLKEARSVFKNSFLAEEGVTFTVD